MKTADEYFQELSYTVSPMVVDLRKVSEGGFRCHCNGSFGMIYAPENKIKATFGVRLCMKHEFGHLILHHLIIQDNMEAKRRLKAIPKWFRFIQRIWYWNKWLRKIRIKLGFSNVLWYGPDELLFGYYRWEHELFADWCSVGKWKGI